MPEALAACTLQENLRLPCVRLFAVRFFLTHGKKLACRVFFLCRAPHKKHTATKLFAVRPK
jgi:hypothetical protein